MRNYSVYIHTSPSGKIYVGLTKQEPRNRWANGKGYHKQIFQKAINKHGWENISSEVIKDGLTLQEAIDKEHDLIKETKSNDSRFGYNVSPGGERGVVHSKETKEQIIETKRLDGQLTLNKEIASEIRRMYNETSATAPELAKLYGVNHRQITRVINNDTWYDKNYVRTQQSKDKKLDMAKAEEIREMYDDGLLSMREIGDMYGVSSGAVYKVVHNMVWVN